MGEGAGRAGGTCSGRAAPGLCSSLASDWPGSQRGRPRPSREGGGGSLCPLAWLSPGWAPTVASWKPTGRPTTMCSVARAIGRTGSCHRSRWPWSLAGSSWSVSTWQQAESLVLGRGLGGAAKRWFSEGPGRVSAKSSLPLGREARRGRLGRSQSGACRQSDAPRAPPSMARTSCCCPCARSPGRWSTA